MSINMGEALAVHDRVIIGARSLRNRVSETLCLPHDPLLRRDLVTLLYGPSLRYPRRPQPPQHSFVLRPHEINNAVSVEPSLLPRSGNNSMSPRTKQPARELHRGVSQVHNRMVRRRWLYPQPPRPL